MVGTLHQYDYVLVMGTFFALLDAYNKGASMYFGSTRNRLLYPGKLF